MANSFTNPMLAQLFAQESDDPFLALLTLEHSSLGSPIRLVNNIEDVDSRGETYTAFPFKIGLPPDDGETQRTVTIELDNASLDFIEEFRSITTAMDATLELILASDPDTVQLPVTDLKLRNISYDRRMITGNLVFDSFLNIEMTSEKYTPQNFRGIF